MEQGVVVVTVGVAFVASDTAGAGTQGVKGVVAVAVAAPSPIEVVEAKGVVSVDDEGVAAMAVGAGEHHGS